MLNKFKFLMASKWSQEKLNLLFFSVGKLISLFGSAIYTFAVGLYLLKITGSGLSFALNIILYTIPIILINPIAGIAADRIDKKTIIVGADILNGLFLFLLYIITLKINFSPVLIYLSTFLVNVLAAFFNVALESSKPQLVGNNKLYNINSIARIIESASYLLGPIIGGIVFSLVNIKFFIIINAVSFLISAVIEYFIDYNYNNIEEEVLKDNQIKKKDGFKFLADLRTAFIYIISNEYLKGLLLIFIALNFFFNFSVIIPLPYLLNTIWKIDAPAFGIIQAAFPAGMITGALFVKRVINKYSYNQLLKNISFSIVFIVIAFPAPLIVLSRKPDTYFILIYYILLMFLSGIIVSFVDIPANTIIQKIVPKKLLGRVISLNLCIVKIIVPISLFLSGYFLDLISPVKVILSASVIFFIFNISFYNSKLGSNFTTKKFNN